MKLQRLIIQGFKSFKDKTVIHFDDGITGIVGPNGCGKSNIVDALFWVMGEQSAKHLRGTKMQDLIFSGSSKYNPSAWAEVSLVLSNEEGKHIHIGQKLAKPSEIQITRKLYRNGETEYRINNFPCRLKDIHEVFMDTGAGAKSYSIIAQGEINRLVQAKPVERRTMIEEVAGITKFKLRRRDSMKKIENTQLNLDRLGDLQTEIYKQLKKLESQSEKAQRAKNLKEKVKRHELIVTSHKEHELLTSFRDLKVGSNEAAVELDELKIRKNSLELSLEDERLQKEEMLDALNSRQSDFNEKSKELAASQERLNYFDRDQIEKEKLRERTQNDIEEIKEYLTTREERLEEIKEEFISLENESTDGIDMAEFHETIESLQETRDSLSESVSAKESQVNDLRAQRSDVERELATVEAQASEYSRSLESMTLEAEELEKETSTHHDSLTGEREKVLSLEKERDTLKAKMTELQEEQAQLKINTNELEAELVSVSREHIQASSKLESLKAVSATLGEDDSYKKFFEHFSNGEVAKLGELIETEAEYGTCVDSLLGEWLSLVVQNDQSVNQWLKKNTDLRINMIKDSTHTLTSTETINRLETLGAIGVRPVSDVVKLSEGDWESTIKNFLDGFYIVDNLNAELMEDISSSINFKGLVSTDGRYVLTKSHGLTVKKFKGNQENGMGFVQRNNQIRELSEAVSKFEEVLSIKEPQLNELKMLKEATVSQLDNTRESYNQLNSKYHALKSAFEAKESFSGNNSAKLTRILEKKKEFSIKRLELLEKEEFLSAQKQEIGESLENILNILDEEKEQLITAQSLFQDKREEFVALKLKVESFESRRQNILNTQKDVESEIERYSEKLEAQSERLEQLQDEFTNILEAIETLKESNSEQAEMLATEEQSLLEQKDTLDTLLTAMQEREDEVKKINVRVTQLEKETAVAATRTEQIISEEELLVRDVFERYQVDLRDTIKTSIELQSEIEEELSEISNLFVMETEEGEVSIAKNFYEFEKRFPGQIKESKEKFRRYKTDLNRLGEINWQAVEDYDKQKLRYDFLKSQEEELKASLADLQIAIDHIDQKSRMRFKEAYDEVNVRFQKVFPIIFGGGSATLKIIGNMDDPECGIDIIAQPPGKKMQNINLMSGGEKAMTAVSLIFSIFLVKPSPFCLLDEVDAPLDDANVGRFNELLREMSSESQFILITHNKKTMELNDMLYGVTMQEPGISKAISVQLH